MNFPEKLYKMMMLWMNFFEEVKTTLIDFIAENKGAQGVEAIDLIMVAKYLERIADHATNIAEWVEFSITGIHNASVVSKKEKEE